MEQLYLYFCGTYQVRMAMSYCRIYVVYAEHVKENGRYEFQVTKEDAIDNYDQYGIMDQAQNLVIIKVRMQSRHKNIKYHVFTLCNLAESGISSIIEYCCTCKTGKRTMSGCAHVACVVWFFTLQNIRSPGDDHFTFFEQVRPLPVNKQDIEELEGDDPSWDVRLANPPAD